MKQCISKTFRSISEAFAKKWKYIYFMILVTEACALTLMFYRMLLGEQHSDLDDHLSSALQTKYHYSINHYIIRLLYDNDRPMLIAIFFAIVSILTPLALYKLFKCIAQLLNLKTNEIALHFTSLGITLMSALYIPAIVPNFYKGTLNFNPWHNDTYTTMRLFMIIALIFFFRIFCNYMDRKVNAVDYFMLTAVLFISTWCKPSFMLAFAPAMLLVLIVDLIRSRKEKNVLGKVILFGLTAVPAGIMVIYQWLKIYVMRENITTNIAVGSANTVAYGAILTKIALMSIIPILVLIYNAFNDNSVIKNRIYGFVWLLFLFGTFWYTFVRETGARASHGNFGWGIKCVAFVLFALSMLLFLHNFIGRKTAKGKKWIVNTYSVIVISLFSYQVLTGIYYLLRVFVGNNYYC